MTTLTLDKNLTTVIIIFRIKLEQQQLVTAIKEFLTVVQTQPDFASVNLHQSLDELNIANYAQLNDIEAVKAFRSDRVVHTVNA